MFLRDITILPDNKTKNRVAFPCLFKIGLQSNLEKNYKKGKKCINHKEHKGEITQRTQREENPLTAEDAEGRAQRTQRKRCEPASLKLRRLKGVSVFNGFPLRHCAVEPLSLFLLYLQPSAIIFSISKQLSK
jgi:hypothetical protein